MMIRCNECMKEFSEAEIRLSTSRSCADCLWHELRYCDGEDPDGCEDYESAEACPYCGAKGCLEDLDWEGCE